MPPAEATQFPDGIGFVTTPSSAATTQPSGEITASEMLSLKGASDFRD